MAQKSHLEAELLRLLQLHRIPLPVCEYRAIPKRRFRYDMAWPESRLLVEIQGGLHMARGGHNTAKGIKRDTEKLNLATLNSWSLFQFTADDIRDFTAIKYIKRFLDDHPPF